MTATASAPVRRVGGELDGVGRGLGAGVDRHLKPASPGLDEALGDPLPLVDGEQDPLAGRPEGEDAVEPTRRGEEVDVGPTASSSSAAPPSLSGVTAAASEPRSMARL